MMIELKKDLYCPNCNNYPNIIIEEYERAYIEIRKFNNDCYELVDANLDALTIHSKCAKCGTMLKPTTGNIKIEEKDNSWWDITNNREIGSDDALIFYVNYHKLEVINYNKFNRRKEFWNNKENVKE